MILTLCLKPTHFDLRSKGRVKRYESYGSFSCFDKQQKKIIKEEQTLAFALVFCPQDFNLTMKVIPILLFLFL